MKIRSKVVEKEAIRWDGREESMSAVFGLLGDSELPHAPDDPHKDSGFGFTPADGVLFIPTLEGTMAAQPGDWIIKGLRGELYPCKPDIFAETYDIVAEKDGTEGGRDG